MISTKKNENGWILCPSKSFPGKFYYFNVINGEAAWCLHDKEKKAMKQDFYIPNVTDKFHTYPEPDTPPFDVTPPPSTKMAAPNVCAKQKSQQNPIPNFPSSQKFGQAIFPQYTTNIENANVVWTTIPMLVTQEIKKPMLDQITQTSHDISGQFRPSCNCIDNENSNLNKYDLINHASTPKKQKLVTVSTILSDSDISEITRKENFDKFRFRPIIQTNSMFKRTRSYSESDKVYSESANVTSDNTSQKVKSNPFYKTQSSNPRSFEMSDKNTINEVEFKKPILNESVLGTSLLTRKVKEKSDLNISNRVENSTGLKNITNLDTCDLRYFLDAKKKHSVTSNNAEKQRNTIVQHPKATKHVTFNLNNLSGEDSVIENNQFADSTTDVQMLCIQTLRDLAAFPLRTDLWYIAVDTEVLLQEFEFVTNFVQTDPSCRLLISESVFADIKAISTGDGWRRQRVVAARQISRRLASNLPCVTVQTLMAENTEFASDPILNCCLQFINFEKCHVVLITNDQNLFEKASAVDIHCYRLREIKDCALQKPEVRFDIQNIKINKAVNSENNLFLQNVDNFDPFPISKKVTNKMLPEMDNSEPKQIDQTNVNDLDKLINITNPKNRKNVVTETNKDIVLNEYETTTSELGHFIQNLKLVDNKPKVFNENEQKTETSKKIFKMPIITDYRNGFAKKNINGYNIEDNLKRFYVKNKVMEDNIKSRMDEWICIYTQTMEDALTDILMKSPVECSVPPPWYLHEALECTRELYSREMMVKLILDKMTILFFNSDCEYGKLKPSMKPQDFLKIFGCGILLIQCLKSVVGLSQLAAGERVLDAALRTMEDATLGLDWEAAHTPVVSRTDLADRDGEARTNFLKQPSDVLMYLQKHFSAWKSHNDPLDCSKCTDNVDNKTTRETKIFRTFGKNLGCLKIDHNKSITMEKTADINLNTDHKKAEMEKHSEKIGKKLDSKNIVTTETITANNNLKVDCEGVEKGKEIVTNNDINDDIITVTSDFFISSPTTLKTIDPLNIKIKKITNSNHNSTAKETRVNAAVNALENLNIPIGINAERNTGLFSFIPHGNTFGVKKDGPKIIRSLLKIDEFEAKLKNKTKLDLDIINLDDTTSGSKNTIANDTIINDATVVSNQINNDKNDILLCPNDLNIQGNDSTNDSGFENDSLHTYFYTKLFFREISSAYKFTYNFIVNITDEVQRGQLKEDKRIVLVKKVNRVHTVILKIIDLLQRIIKRESSDGITLKPLLINAGTQAASDIRMTKYRQVVTKCLEQGRILQNASKLLLYAINEIDVSTLDLESIKYINIFE